MTGNESRPDSGDAGAACPPAVSARAGSVHRFLGAPPGRADRVAQNPSTLAAVFRSRPRCGGRVHTRAGRRPDPGADMTQATRGTQRLRHATYNTANTWTQTASIPRNSETDANAAASSTTARNMTTSPMRERTGNIVRVSFQSQGAAVGQFEMWRGATGDGEANRYARGG